MKRALLPSVVYLSECFTYSPDSGLFFWKERPTHHFTHAWQHRVWNKAWAGKQAFVRIMKKGHLSGTLNGRTFVAHRVAWKMVTGKEPPYIIDHVDRNPKNNRFSNLREAPGGTNRINSTKARGVWLDKRWNKWRAYVRVDGRLYNLGEFHDKEKAVEARRQGVIKYFGEFAP